MSEPNPEMVLKIIQSEKSFRDDKDKILFFHLNIEHYINELICYHANKELHETLQEKLNFESKIKFLKEQKIIEEDVYNALININKLRNFLSHKLILTVDMINDKLNSLKFSYKLPYEIKDENVVDLKEEYRKRGYNKLDQFKISAQLLIGILYTKLRKLKGIRIDQFFYPKFEQREGKETCWILLYKEEVEKKV